MIKKFVHRILLKRHFWREISFDELSELYINTMMRNLALGMIGVFVPVYLYKLGYSVQAILLFYAAIFMFRAIFDIAAGYVVAWCGPKHTMLASYMVQIVVSLQFATQKQFRWPLLLLAFVAAIANSLFFIAYHVDFSKVKHLKHSGKEIGYMYVMDQIGRTMGPLLGGIVATIFGSQFLFVFAVIIMTFAARALLKTGEPVRTHQHLQFSKLNIKPLVSDFASYAMLSIENIVCVMIWPFFLGVFVLLEKVYLQLGLLSSVSILTSILASVSIGHIVDKNEGRGLLRITAVANAIIHVFRPFVGGFFGVLGINLANETVTSGYKLPYTKGLYDRADSLEGFRIVYISSLESFAQLARMCFFAALAIVAGLDARFALVAAFFVGAASSVMIMLERFPALRRR